MYFISYFFLAVAEVISIMLTIFMWVIIARTLLSWVNPDPFNPLVQIINKISEPSMKLIRSKLPTVYAGIDFSPIIIFLSIIFLRTFVINSLMQAARSLI